MDKLGFIILMLGCAGMDGSNMVLSGIMVLVGLALIGIAAKNENSSTHIPTKANAKS